MITDRVGVISWKVTMTVEEFNRVQHSLKIYDKGDLFVTSVVL